MSQLLEHLDDVGEGWHSLLVELHEQLHALDPNYVVGQVKEKFGTLRVYLDRHAAHKEAWDIVETAERKSHSICERCSAPGVLRQDTYYLLTLCDECSAKRLQSEGFTE